MKKQNPHHAFGDLEFRADLDPYMINNPLAKAGYDVNRARYHNDHATTLGNYRPAKGVEGADSLGNRELTETYGFNVPYDSVNAYGAGATPKTWVHEFMHRGARGMNMDPTLEELMIRQWEAANAKTPEDRATAERWLGMGEADGIPRDAVMQGLKDAQERAAKMNRMKSLAKTLLGK